MVASLYIIALSAFAQTANDTVEPQNEQPAPHPYVDAQPPAPGPYGQPGRRTWAGFAPSQAARNTVTGGFRNLRAPHISTISEVQGNWGQPAYKSYSTPWSAGHRGQLKSNSWQGKVVTTRTPTVTSKPYNFVHKIIHHDVKYSKPVYTSSIKYLGAKTNSWRGKTVTKHGSRVIHLGTRHTKHVGDWRVGQANTVQGKWAQTGRTPYRFHGFIDQEGNEGASQTREAPRPYFRRPQFRAPQYNFGVPPPQWGPQPAYAPQPAAPIVVIDIEDGDNAVVKEGEEPYVEPPVEVEVEEPPYVEPPVEVEVEKPVEPPVEVEVEEPYVEPPVEVGEQPAPAHVTYDIPHTGGYYRPSGHGAWGPGQGAWRPRRPYYIRRPTRDHVNPAPNEAADEFEVAKEGSGPDDPFCDVCASVEFGAACEICLIDRQARERREARERGYNGGYNGAFNGGGYNPFNLGYNGGYNGGFNGGGYNRPWGR